MKNKYDSKTNNLIKEFKHEMLEKHKPKKIKKRKLVSVIKICPTCKKKFKITKYIGTRIYCCLYCMTHSDKAKATRAKYGNSEKVKEYGRKYRETDKYKEYILNIRKTRKYKDYMKEYYREYRKTDNYKEYLKKYQQSDSFKGAQKKYKQTHRTEINIANKKRYNNKKGIKQ